MEEGAKLESVMVVSGDDPIAEVGVALAEILHIDNDSNKDVSDGALTSNLGAFNLDIMMPAETKCEPSSATSKIQPNLIFSVEFAPAGGASEMLASVDCAHSLPMVSPKLVSALKGERKGAGTPSASRTKLSVSWAPDVYDPPVTSVCHTVKSNNHRYSRNSRRKDQHHKYKHKKTKHLRGSSSEKKNYTGCQRNFVKDDLVHQHQRLQAVHARTLPLKGLDQPAAVDIMEFSISTGQESKCGSSSFIRTSLEKLHYSFAEA